MPSVNDRDSPFLKPLWRRIALVAFCAAWALWELWNQEMFWAVLVAGITAYAVWTFLIDYDRKPAADAAKKTEE